jgi:D-3-phosphoglycerate dehydrogenase
MEKIKILIADKIDLSAFSFLNKKKYSITYEPGIENDEIISRYNNYECLIIRSIRKINKDFLSKCNFKAIATCSKGIDNIDTKFASKRKIEIINSEDGNTHSAAEHTVALILNILKKINYSDTLVRKNRFTDYNFERNEFFGKKLGIIGYGKVGTKVAKISEAFGAEIIVYEIDPEVRKKYKNVNFKSLAYLLRQSDIVSLHIPLEKRNLNFFSKEKFSLMKQKALFINTSRGSVADEKTLISLLQSRYISFAGLDVFINEPKINNNFLTLKNVILTNHIAGKTEEGISRILTEILTKINIFFNK